MYKNLKSKIKSRQFAVIRRRYSLLEAPRRGIHNAIAKAMSLGVAFSNKVKDTHLPLPVGSGDKHDLERKGLKAPKYNVCSGVQCGRSMIEMLGVLAIIGVLSVSGIAGYSKAMQKWKINKMLDDYTFLISDILEHLDDLKNLSSNSSAIGLIETLQASGSIPANWQKINNLKIWDTNGNIIAIFSRNKELGFSINIGGYHVDSNNREVGNGFSQDICLSLFKDLVQPLHSQLSKGYTYDTKKYKYYYGDKFCNGEDKKCLSQLTLSEMKSACEICDGDTYCDISFVFP